MRDPEVLSPRHGFMIVRVPSPLTFLRRLSPRQVDVIVVVLLLLWALPNVPWWWRPHGHGAATPAVLGYLCVAVLQSAPFLWRRRFPVPLVGLTVVLLAIRTGLRADLTSATIAVLVAAYGVGAYSPAGRLPSRWVGTAAVAAAASTSFVNHRVGSGLPLALLGAAFLAGEAMAARRGETATAVEAAHLAERARIARELHDVVAHQLSAIAVQAGSARVAWQAAGAESVDPGEVLGVVEGLAREAMGELGHLLGALRKDPDDVLARRPAPGLRDLEGLLAAGRRAGLDIELAVQGIGLELSSGADLAAYRIVQEAVTNAARHAPGARALVTVRFGAGEVRIDVVNGPARRGAAASGTSGVAVVSGFGCGVVGMRERAELHGGSMTAGGLADGGFAVRARIPVPVMGRPWEPAPHVSGATAS